MSVILRYESPYEELGVGFLFLGLQYFPHFGAVRFLHFEFPIDQLFIDIHPFVVVGIAVERHEKIPELLLIGGGSLFGDQPFVVDDLFQAEQDLVGIDGFYQIIREIWLPMASSMRFSVSFLVISTMGVC